MPQFTRLQRILWLAVLLAVVGFAWLMLGRGSEQTVTGSFRPEFALADDAGTIRTSAEFEEKFLLVFFGFTNCPDICPTTLAEVAQVMDDLGSGAERVQPVFISVDPERDRRLGLAAYTTAFHPSILGLAGDAAATAAAADSFKIFFEREADAAAPDGYAMSHSPALYLIGPDGVTYGTPATEILADLQKRL